MFPSSMMSENGTPVDIPFTDDYDEPQICFDHPRARFFVPERNPLREFLFLLEGKERGFSDIFQVIRDRFRTSR